MENIASDIREAFWDNMRHPLNDNIKYYINIEKVYVKFWNNILQDIKHILKTNINDPIGNNISNENSHNVNKLLLKNQA
jgi:DNA-directed RNA polymerase subunit L